MTVYDEAAGVSCQDMTPAENISVPRLYRLDDLLQAFADDAAAAHQARATGLPRGPVTGFPTLDAEIGGYLCPGLHMIHGGPGVGKTAFGLQVAATCGAPALYVSCEMAPLELFRRMMARVTGTFLGRLKSGEYPPDRARALAVQTCDQVPGLAIADSMIGYASPDWLRQRAEEIRGDHPHVLLVIDSLHSWAHGADVNDSEYECLNAAIRALTRLAGQLAAPVLVIVERNRANMDKGGMNAGAGTRRIEYTGELVLGLDRDENETMDMAGEVTLTARIEKNRNGVKGKAIPLLFHGALQRYREGGA